MDDGKVHEKRFVIVRIDGDVITCVINTEINKFIANRPDLNRCQVAIKSDTHEFMSESISHIDCTRLRTYSFDEVVDQLVAKGTSWILGTITSDVGGAMQDALKHSRLIAAGDVAVCCDSLSTASLRDG
ncbi:hypothetical protein LGM43_34380 [Burkholderia seminalis]|uniref:hypothetical protein n=1 Tax=Burkholderia seminalis TaxID=488731 RepID=UPI001CF27D55|nr:hypothetical protein [Burkholderia seminalis]MCA7955352.1 hypothetical protein [Burkholderia seminalis]